jgi:hypothetical protein
MKIAVTTRHARRTMGNEDRRHRREGVLGQGMAAQWGEDELVLAGLRDVDVCERRQVGDFLG